MAAKSAVPQISKPGDMALSVLVDQLLPIGIKGLFAAGLIAALMSTIAAALNSISTLVSIDIYKRIKPETTDKSLIRIGRIVSILIMIVAALWSTQGDKFSSVFEAINRVAAALAPPVATVLLFGVLYKRGTSDAAFVTLLAGLGLGVLSFVLDFKFTPDSRAILTEEFGIPFMMQAWWLFCICTVIYFMISLFTKRSEQQVIDKYTWANPSQIISGKLQGIWDIRVITGFLLLTLMLLYFTFSN